MTEKRLSISCALISLALLAPAAWAADEARASRDDAKAMVKKAVAHLQKAGKDVAYKDFTAPNKSFTKNDLYIVVYDMDGKCLAHGQNPKQVGKDLLGLRDPDGKAFVQERVDLAKSKGSFWQDYKFTDPLTKKVMPKEMYCEKANDVVVCGGVYKQ